jgi:speckle-type POZ protein
MSMSNPSASSLRANGGVAVAPSMSASAIIAKAASGSHVLKIDGYSRTVGLGSGSFITSRSFEVGGHRWCLRYYPDSHSPQTYRSCISIVLCLDPSEAGEVRAQYSISLLDHEGKPASGCVLGSNTCRTFSAKGVPRGSSSCYFIDKAVLENYLKGDAFSVRCDINVVMGITTEDVVIIPAVERGIKEEPHVQRHGV